MFAGELNIGARMRAVAAGGTHSVLMKHQLATAINVTKEVVVAMATSVITAAEVEVDVGTTVAAAVEVKGDGVG